MLDFNAIYGSALKISGTLERECEERCPFIFGEDNIRDCDNCYLEKLIDHLHEFLKEIERIKKGGDKNG